MRKLLIPALCVLLALCSALSGCGKKQTPPEEENLPAAPSGEKGKDTTYTLTEHYLPETVSAALKTAITEEPLTAFTGALSDNAPYAVNDGFVLSDCTVRSITIPVHHTGRADSGGNFVFTIFIGGNTREGFLKPAPHGKVQVFLNGEEYGLAENSDEMRLVTVDLSDYAIKLSAGETMAFFAPTDTVVPALLSTQTSAFGTFYRQSLCAGETLMKVYTGATWTNDNPNQGLTECALPLDFELERTWESKEVYDAEVAAAEAEEKEFQRKLAAVLEHWRGKNLSLIGDSISTFGGVSNNTEINGTLGSNAVYSGYSATSNYIGVYPDYTVTYWGIVQTLLEMDLCVVNAWGGSRAYGNANYNWVDNMPQRADQLHTNGGKRPDLILVYMGVNDVRNSPTGNLPDLLAAGGSQNEIVADWFAGVEAKAAATAPDLTPGTTWTDWLSAYALGIKKMKETYPDAEIYCLTIMENYHSSGSHKDQVDAADAGIRAIAEYFGAGVIDQQKNGYMTKQNSILYGRDAGVYGLHPNRRGHAMMARCIIEELYRYLPDA